MLEMAQNAIKHLYKQYHLHFRTLDHPLDFPIIYCLGIESIFMEKIISGGDCGK